MQRYYTDREMYGPDFDDHLIQLVRANPAIYDVSHPNYRRNPVRVAIWERIANELGASSRFLQTKWKNIRYNYLQEIKCLETGHVNANIRKRRFTEDLSFLQHTAQTYNTKKLYSKNTHNSSDNDSNSYMYPDSKGPNAFEVIEIEHSDDGEMDPDYNSTKMDEFNISHGGENYAESMYAQDNKPIIAGDVTRNMSPTGEDANTGETIDRTIKKHSPNRQNSHNSDTSSPLLTPVVVMDNGQEYGEMNGEVTIEPIPKRSKYQQRNNTRSLPPTEIMENATKRKSMPAPFPVLTPINDPIELYCLSLVDSLRNMPRSERERVKFEFANILKDAKYKDQS